MVLDSLLGSCNLKVCFELGGQKRLFSISGAFKLQREEVDKQTIGKNFMKALCGAWQTRSVHSTDACSPAWFTSLHIIRHVLIMAAHGLISLSIPYLSHNESALRCTTHLIESEAFVQ